MPWQRVETCLACLMSALAFKYPLLFKAGFVEFVNDNIYRLQAVYLWWGADLFHCFSINRFPEPK